MCERDFCRSTIEIVNWWKLLRQRALVLEGVVGLIGGIVGAAYLAVLHVATAWIGPDASAPLRSSVVLVVTGVVVALGTRLLGPTGNVELLVDNIHVRGGAEGVRETRSMVPLSLLCVAAGGAMGPEAPLVQTTGTLGSWVAGRLEVDQDRRRVLTITGMAAGFTVLFGAPLGGALFALEILHRRSVQYYEAIVPALVGSLVGYAIAACTVHAGLAPVWQFPPVGNLAPTDLLWALAAGAFGAAGGWVFMGLANGGRRVLTMVPAHLHAVLGGALLAALALVSPYALTYGEAQLDELLAAKLAAGALAVALLAKLAGTLVTLVSGWKGGFIIPLFFCGAAAGEIAHTLVPSANEAVVVAACMVALCVAVTKTPLGSTLVVTEMAGLTLLPTTILAATVALLATQRVGLIDSQRDRLPVVTPAREDTP
jgi:H+/Cl- antiporter ClcA